MRLLVFFIGLGGCAATAAAQIPNYVPQNGLGSVPKSVYLFLLDMVKLGFNFYSFLLVQLKSILPFKFLFVIEFGDLSVICSSCHSNIA